VNVSSVKNKAAVNKAAASKVAASKADDKTGSLGRSKRREATPAVYYFWKLSRKIDMKLLRKLRPFDRKSRNLNVVIDTPKGSRNKYAFDFKINAYKLKTVLPHGSVFPFDFGSIPGTTAQDGDPLDVLVNGRAGVCRMPRANTTTWSDRSEANGRWRNGTQRSFDRGCR
jgi:hypothetical protein